MLGWAVEAGGESRPCNVGPPRLRQVCFLFVWHGLTQGSITLVMGDMQVQWDQSLSPS